MEYNQTEREQLEYLGQLYTVLDTHKRAFLIKYAEELAKSEMQIDGDYIEIPYRTDLLTVDRNAYRAIIRYLDIMTGAELASLYQQLEVDAVLNGRGVAVFQRQPETPQAPERIKRKKEPRKK